MQPTHEPMNASLHILGCIGALMGSVLLIVHASLQQHALRIVAYSIYGATLCLLFFASALHHSVAAHTSSKKKLLAFDQIGVFLLIMGTFIPFGLLHTPTALGWSIIGVVVAVCLTGIVLRLYLSTPWLLQVLYVGAGWLGVLFIPYLPLPSALFLVGGGVLYTIGAFIYGLKKPNIHPLCDHHALWHLLVIGGASMHWVALFLLA
ncbi:MAG: PAQR family membrane homeostasis protein TrhA [Candidatus Woesearchaeota archaeon]